MNEHVHPLFRPILNASLIRERTYTVTLQDENGNQMRIPARGIEGSVTAYHTERLHPGWKAVAVI